MWEAAVRYPVGRGSGRLGALVPLDDDEIVVRVRSAYCDQPLVFGRVVASERGLVAVEFEDDGHWNGNGHDVAAEAIASSKLMARLRQ